MNERSLETFALYFKNMELLDKARPYNGTDEYAPHQVPRQQGVNNVRRTYFHVRKEAWTSEDNFVSRR